MDDAGWWVGSVSLILVLIGLVPHEAQQPGQAKTLRKAFSIKAVLYFVSFLAASGEGLVVPWLAMLLLIGGGCAPVQIHLCAGAQEEDPRGGEGSVVRGRKEGRRHARRLLPSPGPFRPPSGEVK